MADAGPLIVSSRGHRVRVRHDDPRLGIYTPSGAVIRNTIYLASDIRGLELALDATVGDRYHIKVAEQPEGVAIGLRRLSTRLGISGDGPGTKGRSA